VRAFRSPDSAVHVPTPSELRLQSAAPAAHQRPSSAPTPTLLAMLHSHALGFLRAPFDVRRPTRASNLACWRKQHLPRPRHALRCKLGHVCSEHGRSGSTFFASELHQTLGSSSQRSGTPLGQCARTQRPPQGRKPPRAPSSHFLTDAAGGGRGCTAYSHVVLLNSLIALAQHGRARNSQHLSNGWDLTGTDGWGRKTAVSQVHTLAQCCNHSRGQATADVLTPPRVRFLPSLEPIQR
jgi:hypothetical protein